ncbi:MAG: indolepyruvate ferredoxin oxidoreductase family protein, partial [Minwuiales bacterium]|nr:indolepyruvate ferredoxin oxidoreductase family protein [Minwuiales bacterium]
MALANVSLDDKYELEAGKVYLTGIQALVRLPMMQRQRDMAAGLNTAGLVTGYRGSPLGGYDHALWRAKPFLERNHIVFQPGLNEDLAATAIWGSQQTGLHPGAKYDGVFAIWYGKGPGVDRSGDVFKHGNNAGPSKHGGVLLIAGDDHGAKSSAVPHQSEQAFAAALIPVLNPSNVQEYLDFGLYGIALSRYSGCWIGFKAVSDTVESSASVSVDPARLQFREPEDIDLPDDGMHIGIRYDPLGTEAVQHDHKLPAVLAFARANPIDRIIVNSPNARLGIVTTGKAYLDVRQALDELGIDDAAAADLGIRLYKVGLTWPLEPQGALAFADGLEEILVIEEKQGFIETQLTRLLYNLENAPRRIVGKTDEQGNTLLPAKGELSPPMIAKVIAGRVDRMEERPEFRQRLARIESIDQREIGGATLVRLPFFCSGCPHNTGTRLPDGSRAMAGIGCHAMAIFDQRRRTEYATHMGGEGVNWIGLAPFTEEKHIFANLGDGTYYHSGILAIRAAIAAKVNITYKILYNDAVAMTGGQPLEEGLTVDAITRQVAAEGVNKVVVVTDEPDKYPVGYGFAPGVTVHHRDSLDRVQRELREMQGVTVLVYDQTCAAEKRRRRKRGTYPDPQKRIFINDLVCEGCGDCSAKSNCVSVQPLETDFGRKRQIDQSNCNKDYSCIKGFCPSFVTVHGGRVRKAAPAGPAAVDGDPFADLPMPSPPSTAEPYGVVVTGIGGTGVITIGALLGMAAHLEGKGVTVLDQTGLAQKNGAVATHVRIADRSEDLHSVRVAAGGARLLLGCDIVVAAAPDTLSRLNQGASRAVVNSHVTPPAAFVMDQAIDLSGGPMRRSIENASGDGRADFVDATKLATALMGDSIATNLFMVGYAFQKGLIPLSLASIERAVELNGVAVEANKRTIAWGRLTAHDPAAVEAIAGPLIRGESRRDALSQDLDSLVKRRAAFLTDYQDAAYATRYTALVDRVAEAEQSRAKGRRGLAEAVARNYFKLMAYKDEYEVARLYTD